MKIAKCTLMVMKDKKIDNFYKLLENAITCGVAASILLESDNDDMILLHMQLRHLGKHDRFELHKMNLMKCVEVMQIEILQVLG